MPAAKLFGEPSRLIQMFDIANIWICFELANKKAETFKVPAKNYYKCRLTNSIILSIKTMYQ